MKATASILAALLVAGCSRGAPEGPKPEVPPVAVPEAPGKTAADVAKPPETKLPPGVEKPPEVKTPAPETKTPAKAPVVSPPVAKDEPAGKRRRGRKRLDSEKGGVALDPNDPLAFLKARVNLDRGGTFFATAREVMKTGDKERMRAIGDFLLANQNLHGGWPQAIKPGEPPFSPYLGETPGVVPEDGKMDRPILMLMEISEATGDAKYLDGAKKGGDGLLKAQNKEGSWPHEWCADEALMRKQTEFLGMHCMNDQATVSSMKTLVSLWERTKDERYRAAVERAGEWLLAAQLHGTVSGWAQQYDAAGKPCFGRAFEPPGLGILETKEAMFALLDYYLKVKPDASAKAKVKAAIEESLAWLEKAHTPKGWAAYYDPATGRPVCAENRKVVFGVSGVDVHPKKPYREGYYAWGGMSIPKVRSALREAMEAKPAEPPPPPVKAPE